MSTVTARFGEAADEPQAIEESLRRLFGFDHFRPGQREAVEAIRSGRDALIIMPTGAGKSLCYQLPAMMNDGVTLVISPLVALMKDQVDGLLEIDLPVTAINSMLDPSQRAERQSEIARGRYKLVYVAPERFRSRTFLRCLKKTRVNLIVVDEAHCVSQWGHDFRPDYLRIAEVRRQLGDPQAVGLTATATRAVQKDIIAQLALKDPRVEVSGFERPNLHFEVRRVWSREEKLADLREVLAGHAGDPAIVYCCTRKQVESVTQSLVEGGVSARMYHAGLQPGVRAATQDSWMAGEVDVLVATNAFGMGVDRPDVRAIVHWNIPGSLEAYYQEAGRAGRDGAPSSCVVLYGQSDRDVRDFFVDNTHPPRRRIERMWEWLLEQDDEVVRCNIDDASTKVGPPGDRLHPLGWGNALRILGREGHVARSSTSGKVTTIVLGDRVAREKLRVDWARHERRRAVMEQQLADMLSFVEHDGCLQAHLIRHFNTTPSFGDRCGHCANCTPFAPHDAVAARSGEVAEETVRLVKILLSAVARIDGVSDAAGIAAVVCGSRSKRVTGPGFHELSVHGLLKGQHGQRTVVRMLEGLVRTRMVRRTPFDFLELTRHGREVMTGRQPVWLPVSDAVEEAARAA